MSEILNRGMSEVADDLELDFRLQATVFTDIELPPWEGPGRGVYRNVMFGTWHGERVWIFDFAIAEDSDSDVKAEDIRTAICISNEAIQWPQTKISPCRTVDRVANWLFKRESSEETCEAAPRYVFESDDPHWPGLSDSRLKKLLDEHDNLEIGARPGTISIHRTQYRLEPYEVEEHLELAQRLLEIVLDSAEAPDLYQREAETNPYLKESQRSKFDRLMGTVVALLVLAFCGCHLWQAHRQWKAAEFASTLGWMTVVKFDDGALSAMSFEYLVNGNVYKGGAKDRRLVWRPIRIGDDKAQRLKVNWRQGARATVFYDPQNPEVGVLDNSFTKGDANFVKLLLAVCGVCVTYIGWPLIGLLANHAHAVQLRNAKPIEATSTVRYPLPLAPYTLDALAFAIVPFSLFGLVWLVNLAVEPGGWMPAAQFWLQVLVGLNIVIAPLVYLWERTWRGQSGGHLIARPRGRELVIPQPGRDALKVGYDQIRSIRMRATATDASVMSVMNGYDPIVSYVTPHGARQEVMVTRYFSRELARRCVSWLRSTVEMTSTANTRSVPNHDRTDQDRRDGERDRSYRPLLSRCKPEQIPLIFGGIAVTFVVLDIFGMTIVAVAAIVALAIVVLVDALLAAEKAK